MHEKEGIVSAGYKNTAPERIRRRMLSLFLFFSRDIRLPVWRINGLNQHEKEEKRELMELVETYGAAERINLS